MVSNWFIWPVYLFTYAWLYGCVYVCVCVCIYNSFVGPVGPFPCPWISYSTKIADIAQKLWLPYNLSCPHQLQSGLLHSLLLYTATPPSQPPPTALLITYANAACSVRNIWTNLLYFLNGNLRGVASKRALCVSAIRADGEVRGREVRWVSVKRFPQGHHDVCMYVCLERRLSIIKAQLELLYIERGPRIGHSSVKRWKMAPGTAISPWASLGPALC